MAFCEAELEAIASAKKSLHIECYIFRQGRLAPTAGSRVCATPADRLVQCVENHAAYECPATVARTLVSAASIAKRLEQDFETDLKQSRQISYDEWKRRSILEKIGEWFGWLLINQA